MIEEELIEILGDRTDDGQRLNDVVGQFRRGRDMADLVVLLDSEDTELVSIGAWILGELPLAHYSDETFASRLRRLTDHVDAAVRFHAFGALYPALNPEEAGAQAIVRKLLSDPNDGVRIAAEAAAARLGLK